MCHSRCKGYQPNELTAWLPEQNRDPGGTTEPVVGRNTIQHTAALAPAACALYIVLRTATSGTPPVRVSESGLSTHPVPFAKFANLVIGCQLYLVFYRLFS